MPRPGDDAAIEELLATWPVGRLAMVGAAGGGPWVTPVVFVPVRKSVWTPIDGKPKSGNPLARLANAAAAPRAALLLDEYSQDWSRLWWVRIEGTGLVHRPGRDPKGAAATAIAALREKYPQYRTVPLFSGPPTLLELSIERARGWSASGSGPAAGLAVRGSGGPGDHWR